MALEVLTFVKSSWIKPLWKQLGRITGERKKELDRLRDEFVDPEQLRGLYIEPYLQDRNPADSHQDDLVSAAQQLAFERINGFFRGELPLEKDGRHQMFILSDAGMGKTSLLLMIKLMHLTNFWPTRISCALFKLGEDTLDRVQALPKKGETILLLDALDEDPKAWKRIKERLLELLQASEDFRRVVISSRTQFFPEMEPDRLGRPEIKVLSGYHCPVLYLSPFNDDQVQEFIERKLPLCWYHLFSLQSGRILKERNRAAYLLKQMQDLRMRPMLLQHIDKLLAADERQEWKWNVYTVYEALIEQWLDREERKLLKQYSAGTSITKTPTRDELFNACLRIAEAMERKGEKIISEDVLQTLFNEDDDLSWLANFEPSGHSLLNRNSDRAFRFSHFTIQEFLLAWGVVHGQLVGKEPLRSTDQLVRFIDLAAGIAICHTCFDMTDFSITRYIEKYWLLRDKMKNGTDGPEMVMLPSGAFRMGDIQGLGNDNERPVHKVELDSFAIGRYPVTFAEYDAFCLATGRNKPKNQGWDREQRPVINVNWQDATEYCQWLSKETGQYYRLPTEAEWEYACRAGAETMWCLVDDKELFGDYAWYERNSRKKTHPVGEKKANAWGLHDMHGNVWEWCRDWQDDGYYVECHKQGVVKNPLGPSSGGGAYVVRGGSWTSGARFCRSACRYGFELGFRFDYLGFRCARDLKK